MTSRIVPFKQVDVFSATPFQGNPVAVVMDAEGLDTAQMQRIAQWTNLSETTFVLPPTKAGADYRVRIFTPRQELPFAGHPTVGTAHAVLECGWAREHDHMLVMECAAGVLPISVEGKGSDRMIQVRTPAATIADADTMQTVAMAKALGTTLNSEPAPRAITCGPTWIVVDLESAATVRALKPDMAKLIEVSRDFAAVGAAVFGRCADDEPEFEMVVRCFAPIDGINEDPVTGSGNAAVANFLRVNGLVPDGPASYVASQGRELGRDGVVTVSFDREGHIAIGGQAVTIVDGTIRL